MDRETVTDSFVGLGLISHLFDIEWLLSVCDHSPVVNFDDSCLKVPPPRVLIRHRRILWVINLSGNFMIWWGYSKWGGVVLEVGLMVIC